MFYVRQGTEIGGLFRDREARIRCTNISPIRKRYVSLVPGDYGASSGALDALQLAWKEWLEYKVGAIMGNDSN